MRDYIKIKKPFPLPDLTSHQRALNDDIWKDLVFYHLLAFYKNHSNTEVKHIIKTEQAKPNPRTERAIAKYIRRQLNNTREFSLCFKAFGEPTNDEDVEGSYDIVIYNTNWKNAFYFECKNLNNSQDLVNKYVFYRMTPTKNDGGVYRYFNGKYAQGQNFGGMIGFILEGTTNTIKNKILEKLNTKFDTSPDGDLKQIIADSIETNSFTFNSIHLRKNKDFILHHLLFNFK